MTLQEFHAFTETTAIYPREHEEEYLQLGLISEVGEVAGLLKRRVRDGVTNDKEQMLKELGDCAWYLVRLYFLEGFPKNSIDDLDIGFECNRCSSPIFDEYRATPSAKYLSELANMDSCPANYKMNKLGLLIAREGFTPDQVLEANVAKLSSRAQRGTLHGSGDER